MDTSLLQSFLVVAHTKSFSSAAQRLNLTQSTVSHHIARLEDHLGKQLFERTTRMCRLTADGYTLLEHAGAIIRMIDDMEQTFKPSSLRGTVAVGIPDDRHLYLPLSQALRRFMEDKPSVAVEIRAGLTADLSRDLRERQIDLAILREVPALDFTDALATEELVWVGAEDWTPPSDGIIPLALVAGSCAYRRLAITALDERKQPWKCLVSCTSLEGVMEFVKSGLAISIVTEGDLRPGTRAIQQHALLPKLPLSALKIQFSEQSPSLLSKTLAKTLTSAISVSLNKRMPP